MVKLDIPGSTTPNTLLLNGRKLTLMPQLPESAEMGGAAPTIGDVNAIPDAAVAPLVPIQGLDGGRRTKKRKTDGVTAHAQKSCWQCRFHYAAYVMTSWQCPYCGQPLCKKTVHKARRRTRAGCTTVTEST